MTPQPGRALAWLRSSSLSVSDLREMGWRVDDLGLDDLVLPLRDFAQLEEAKAAATQDFPPGTTVNWRTRDGQLAGGFIVGHEGVAPPLGELVPAFVLWPDHSENHVETRRKLAGLLRERLEWLVELALAAGFDADEIQSGQAEALRALTELEAGGRLTPACCGPRHDVRCVAKVEPLAWLRWDGFREGWDRPDGPPINERRHAVHYQYEGEFQRFWREAVSTGIAARRQAAL